MYDREEELVADFIVRAADPSAGPWGRVRLITEFANSHGRTDLLAMTDDRQIIAFEAKLANWRVALHQAYRNTSYADYSYVVLPEPAASRAMRCEGEFLKRSVGLCYFHDSQIQIALEAPKCVPIEPWLTQRAAATILERSGRHHGVESAPSSAGGLRC